MSSNSLFTKQDGKLFNYKGSKKSCHSQINPSHLLSEYIGVLHLFGSDNACILAVETYSPKMEKTIFKAAVGIYIPANQLITQNSEISFQKLELSESFILHQQKENYVSIVSTAISGLNNIKAITDKINSVTLETAKADSRAKFVENVFDSMFSGNPACSDFLSARIRAFVLSIKHSDHAPQPTRLGL